MRKSIFVLFGLLYLGFLPVSYAQLSTVPPAYTTTPSTSLHINIGWGAGDGQHIQDDYTLMSLGLRLQSDQKLMILRLEEGWDALSDRHREYRLNEVKVLCGYAKLFEKSNIYIATGISRSYHYFSGSYLEKTQDGTIAKAKLETFWGIPLETGFMIQLSNKINLGGTLFGNAVRKHFYVGYLMQVSYQLF